MLACAVVLTTQYTIDWAWKQPPEIVEESKGLLEKYRKEEEPGSTEKHKSTPLLLFQAGLHKIGI